MHQVKESLRADPRFKLVEREEREELFDAIVAELRAVELEVERAANAKKEEEVSLLISWRRVGFTGLFSDSYSGS